MTTVRRLRSGTVAVVRLRRHLARAIRRRLLLAVIEHAPPGDLSAAVDAARARVAARATLEHR